MSIYRRMIDLPTGEAMINEPMTEYLPQVRCTATLKQRLQRVVADSVSRELADHLRYATERYVESEEQRLGLPPFEGYETPSSHQAQTN